MTTKCGISIPQTFEQSVDVELIRKFVVRAEQLGYESLWVQEQMITDVAILVVAARPIQFLPPAASHRSAI